MLMLKFLLWILIMFSFFSFRSFLLLFLLAFLHFPLFAAGKSALQLKKEALKQESIQESIQYVKNNIDSCASKADTRSSLNFLATLQEQLGLYTDASYSYARAAGIAAKDAEGMEKISAERLVLRAVRCALNSGDWERADSYLNSAVRASSDKEVLAYVNLYSVWASLCKAQSFKEASDVISLMQAYISMESMVYVKSQLLFTLWYVTGKEEYAKTLQKDYPLSPEAAVTSGKSRMASVPFWYFLPRVEKDTGKIYVSSKSEDSSVKENTLSPSVSSSTTSGKKLQAGFFGVKANADDLIKRLSKKGFTGYIRNEKRASGKIYYAVIVEDDDGSMEKKLKAAGFDCYQVK